MPVRSDDVYLFHYTNPRGRQGILGDEVVRVTPADGRFAWFGRGVYMTSMAPTAGRHAILYNNHRKRETRDRNLWAKTSVYFRFSSDHLDGVRKQSTRDGRDVWVYPNDIHLRLVPHATGLTDDYVLDDDDVTPYRIVLKPLVQQQPDRWNPRPIHVSGRSTVSPPPAPAYVRPLAPPAPAYVRPLAPPAPAYVRPAAPPTAAAYVRPPAPVPTSTVIDIAPPTQTQTWSRSSSSHSSSGSWRTVEENSEDKCCCIIL